MGYADMLGTNTIAFLCVHKWIICHETRNDLYDIASQFMDVCPRSGGDFGGNLHIVARYITIYSTGPTAGARPLLYHKCRLETLIVQPPLNVITTKG